MNVPPEILELLERLRAKVEARNLPTQFYRCHECRDTGFVMREQVGGQHDGAKFGRRCGPCLERDRREYKGKQGSVEFRMVPPSDDVPF